MSTAAILIDKHVVVGFFLYSKNVINRIMKAVNSTSHSKSSSERRENPPLCSTGEIKDFGFLQLIVNGKDNPLMRNQQEKPCMWL